MGCDIKMRDDDARYDEAGCVWGLRARDSVFVCVCEDTFFCMKIRELWRWTLICLNTFYSKREHK